jgi:hypothetical protein
MFAINLYAAHCVTGVRTREDAMIGLRIYRFSPPIMLGGRWNIIPFFGNTSRLLRSFLTSQHQWVLRPVRYHNNGTSMGYKYQNKLDEENERLYWSRFPRWYRILARIFGMAFIAILIVLGVYGTIGWVILRFL